MAGKGGGAWKVAYADFVTAMMAFFLVMWITAQSNSMKQAIANYFEHPYDAASRSPIQSKSSGGSSLIPLSRAMDGAPPRSSTKGKSTRGGGMLADEQTPADPLNVPKSGGLRKRSGFILRDADQSGMGTVIQFDDNSVELDDRARQALHELIPVFRGKLNKIEIRGHTTSQSAVGEGSVENQWQLSYARCLATMKYLEQHGIEPKRMRLSQAGTYEPPPPDNQPEWQDRNSRVEVYMLGEYVDDYLGKDNQGESAARTTPAPESKADSNSQPKRTSPAPATVKTGAG